jgi:hypothetical protein
MIKTVRVWKDRLFGSGDASITIPVLDGALKSNNLLEDAPVFAALESPEDLATDGHALFVADGRTVLRYDATTATDSGVEVHRFDRPISALACLPGGGLAVALEGRELRITGGAYDGRRWDAVAGRSLNAVNAISACSGGRLLVTDGSREHSAAHWKNDLMLLGHSGRVLELNVADGGARELASGLEYAFGVCAVGDAVWTSESWRHRVMAFNDGQGIRPVTGSLPGYPSRIAPAQGGGYWLTCFALRTQLVEFVLREPAYRKRMIEEIEPQYWIAPALNSGNTNLEPMQSAQTKTMGIVKPWAPPRSYGLVIRLTSEGLVRYSLHSRFDGKHHGVVAAVECQGNLYVLAKGCRRILRLSVADAERSLQA